MVDGHTRLAAAQKIHLNKVPITLKEFVGEDEALQYAIRSQCNRRNLSDAELLTCLSELDKRKMRGGNSIASREAIGKFAEKTADLLGISRTKVEQLRTVYDHAPEKLKEAVSRGDISINKAYKETMKQRCEEDAGAAKTPTGDELRKLKESRLEVLKADIVRMVKTAFEREIQEYPEIRFSLKERKELNDRLASEIGKLIATMLPKENEDEQ